MFKHYRIRDYDFKLIIMVLAASVIGILAVGSAKESLQNRQIAGVVMGFVAMVIISFIDYSMLLKLHWLMYAGNLVLLGAVLFSSVGDSANGSQRWLEIGSFRFQPSELAKILLILFFAQYIMLNRERLNSFGIILLSLVLIGIPMVPIVKEDLSTTIVIAIVFCVMMYLGGLSHKLILAVIAITVPVTVIFLTMVIRPDQKILADYQQKRILAWLYPDEYKDTEAYQQNNSMMAIGSGQLLGKGYNNNEIGSVKNGNFISEGQTDFIFAVTGEELGFIGCATIILLLALIVLECIWIGKRSREFSGTLICCGVAGYIGFQSFVNICVATGIMPNTGIPLPFVSYGMTSLVTLFLAIGFVLNVGLQPKKY